jgi:acetyl-CoA synthetase (ADP-forming)
MNNAMDLIKEALARGQSVLGEYESKRCLSGFGIPVVREVITPDTDSAVTEAMKIGFPVALKASGPELTHKTEAGAVVLNLRNEAQVKDEACRLLKIQGCAALLVQEMVTGHRELVCGLTRDAQFGPCVMFGLGGVLTELVEDVVFRIAPLTSWDAHEMMGEIRTKKIIEPFRGEPAVNTDVLAQTLVALGEIGLQCEAVQEIDVNPLKIRSDGMPVAVDALVVLKDRRNVDR